MTIVTLVLLVTHASEKVAGVKARRSRIGWQGRGLSWPLDAPHRRFDLDKLTQDHPVHIP
ncbi:hypothetical protein AB0B89_20345 [Sphaerisporangium sp. NPDC049002]|uniref:hypothetical protein n=1 Tax=unclassified Sphaerisporangium TaxID=2630420 RepID=UPI0033FE07D2